MHNSTTSNSTASPMKSSSTGIVAGSVGGSVAAVLGLSLLLFAYVMLRRRSGGPLVHSCFCCPSSSANNPETGEELVVFRPVIRHPHRDSQQLEEATYKFGAKGEAYVEGFIRKTHLNVEAASCSVGCE